MENFKSYTMLLLITMTFFLPVILNFAISGIHYIVYFKATQDVVDFVRHEGGVTTNVQNYVTHLEEKGFEIDFKNLSTGNSVTGTVDAGTTILIEYSYQFKTVTKDETIQTSNTALIIRR